MDMYTENIIDLYKNPRNKGTLENPTHENSRNNPLCGDEITIQLITDNNNIKEVILATDTSLEGDATSIFLASQLEKIDGNIKVSKLARGIPIGGQFEYIDEMTLTRAFDDRKEI